MLNETQFAQLLTSVAEIFDKELSANTIRIYYKMFQKFTIEQLNTAFEQILKTHEYNTMPKPAQILRFLDNGGLDIEQVALSKWMIVRDTIRKHGYYDSVCFDDKIIHGVIENMGGWQAVCDIETDKMQWAEKDFIRQYCVLKQNPRSNYPAKLIGFHELNNMNKYPEDVPETIQIKTDFEDRKMLG